MAVGAQLHACPARARRVPCAPAVLRALQCRASGSRAARYWAAMRAGAASRGRVEEAWLEMAVLRRGV